MLPANENCFARNDPEDAPEEAGVSISPLTSSRGSAPGRDDNLAERMLKLV
jgi:hypothetical protein